MTTYLIFAVLIFAGWFGWQWIKRKAKAARAPRSTTISKAEAEQIEAHMSREELQKLRLVATKKVNDKRAKALEEFYFYEELER